MDSPTIEKISRLHPSIRNEVSKIINECDKALTIKFQRKPTYFSRWMNFDNIFLSGIW